MQMFPYFRRLGKLVCVIKFKRIIDIHRHFSVVEHRDLLHRSALV